MLNKAASADLIFLPSYQFPRFFYLHSSLTHPPFIYLLLDAADLCCF